MSEDNFIGDYLKEVLQLLVDGMSSSIEPPNKKVSPHSRTTYLVAIVPPLFGIDISLKSLILGTLIFSKA